MFQLWSQRTLERRLRQALQVQGEPRESRAILARRFGLRVPWYWWGREVRWILSTVSFFLRGRLAWPFCLCHQAMPLWNPGASQDFDWPQELRALGGSSGHIVDSSPSSSVRNQCQLVELAEMRSLCSMPWFLVSLGGKPGIIKMTIVQEDIPQLLSVGLLEHTGAVIDVAKNQLEFRTLGSSTMMNRLSSGHRTIDVASWKGGVFSSSRAAGKQSFCLKPGAFQ